VSGKRYIEAEACWSEAEIPSEAKRQRGTLKPETSVFVIDDKTEIYLLNGETECGNLSPAVTGDHFASTYGDMSSWDLSTPVILPCSNNEGYPVQTSQMSPLINEVNEKPGPQFDYECTS
jgi:hypothetical protein